MKKTKFLSSAAILCLSSVFASAVVISPSVTADTSSAATQIPSTLLTVPVNAEFDAQDTNNAINDYTIRTKIAGQPFDINIVNKTAVAGSTDVFLVDNKTNQSVTEKQELNFNVGERIKTVSFKTDQPYQDVSVEFAVCQAVDASGNVIGTVNMDACEIDLSSIPSVNTQANGRQHGHIYRKHNGKTYIGCGGVQTLKGHFRHKFSYQLNNSGTNKQITATARNNVSTFVKGKITPVTPEFCINYYKSTDNFAIRPERFLVKTADRDYYKAGENFDVEISVLNANGQSVNYTLDTNNVTAVPAAYKITDPAVTANMQNELGLNSSDPVDQQVLGTLKTDKAVNGTFTLEYSETGVIIPQFHEVKGKEFAKVDENDNGITDNELYITPNTQIFDTNSGNVTALVFKPYQLNISLNNQVYPSWKYMDVLKTSEALNSYDGELFKITPVNKNGTPVLNYNKNCFAAESSAPEINGKKLIVTEPVQIVKKINSNDTATLALSYTLNGTTRTASVNIPNGNSQLITVIPVTDMINGKDIEIDYRLSVAKDIQTWSAPVNITVKSVQAQTVSSSISSAENNINKTTEFRYGAVSVLPVVTSGQSFVNNVVYQYFNGTNWVINTEHTAADGQINASKSITPYMTMSVGNINDGIQPLNFSILTNDSFNTKVELAIPEYLWVSPLGKEYKDPTEPGAQSYNHPSFEVIHKSTNLGSASVINTNIANDVDKVDIDTDPNIAAPVKLPQILKYSY